MKRKKALTAGVWYSISNIMLRAISIVTAPIFTRLLSTSDYGKVSNFNSWQNMLLIFFGLCLNYSIGRAKIDYAKDFDGYVSSIQFLSSSFALLLCIGAFPFLNVISAFMEIDKSLLITMGIYLIFFPSIDYMQAKLRFEYRYKENIFIAALNTVLVIGLSILLILNSDMTHKYIGRIYGMVYPSIAIAVFCYFRIVIKGREWKNKNYWNYALRFSIPMLPHALAMVALGQIDRIMIIKLIGDSEAGIYSFGYSYAIILSVVTNSIMNAWQPWLYDCVEEKKNYDILVSNRMLNSFVCVMTIAFVAVAPEALMLLGSKDYWAAKEMIVPVTLGTLFQFFYSYFVMMEMYCKKTMLISWGSVGAAFVNFILNAVFIPIYGYNAAAYTTMVGYFLLLIYHWIAFKSIYKEKIFAEKQIAVLCAGTTFICFVIMLLYNYFVIRYVVGSVIGIVYVVTKRKTIMTIVRKMHNRRI